jgi:arylsulfatase A-like enzyme
MARGFQRYELLSDPKARLPLLSSLTRAGILETQPYAQADAVRRRLASHMPSLLATDAPLFLYLHVLDPHDPLLLHPDLPADPGSEGLDPLDRLYRDETRFALREITGMIEMLKQTPRWERTLLVVLSDHGEMMPSDGHQAPVEGDDGQPKNYGHGFALYESLVRVPLVIRPPGGLPAHREVDALASHVDLHNTIVELLGISLEPLGHDRVSLAGWLAPTPGDVPRREEAVSGSIGKGPRQRALRVDGFKLIDFPDGERLPELYDLARDPGETRSLHAVRPAEARERRDRLQWIWAQLGESPESAPVRLTPEMQEQLEALGYIDGAE